MAVVMSAPPAYFNSGFDQAPAYNPYTGAQSTPAYSDTADVSERVLDSTAPASPTDATVSRIVTNDPQEPDFVYETDHMKANLGSRIWGLRQPAYGKEGHIEGSLRLSGEEAHIVNVQARVRTDSNSKLDRSDLIK